MKKNYLFLKAALLSAAMASLVTGTAFAQSYNSGNASASAQVSSQLSTVSTMVNELATIEAGRQGVIGNVASQLQQIGIETQSQITMPTSTVAERATIASNLAQITGRISNLSLVVQGVIALGNQEASILGNLQLQLLNLKNAP